MGYETESDEESVEFYTASRPSARSAGEVWRSLFEVELTRIQLKVSQLVSIVLVRYAES